MGLLKRLLAVVKAHRSALSPSTPMSSASPPITLRARLQHLLPRQPDHAGNTAPPVVDVPFAWGQVVSPVRFYHGVFKVSCISF